MKPQAKEYRRPLETKNDMETDSMLESPEGTFPNPKLKEQICVV